MKKIAFSICLTVLFTSFSIAQDDATIAPAAAPSPDVSPVAEVVQEAAKVAAPAEDTTEQVAVEATPVEASTAVPAAAPSEIILDQGIVEQGAIIGDAPIYLEGQYIEGQVFPESQGVNSCCDCMPVDCCCGQGNIVGSAPFVSYDQGFVSEPAPVSYDQGIVAESAPVVSYDQGFVAEPAPAVSFDQGIIAESTPVVSYDQGIVAEPAPVVSYPQEAAPLAFEAPSVVSAPVAAPEFVAPAPQATCANCEQAPVCNECNNTNGRRIFGSVTRSRSVFTRVRGLLGRRR